MKSRGITPGLLQGLVRMADTHANQTLTREGTATRARQELQAYHEGEIAACKAEMASRSVPEALVDCWGTRQDGWVVERASAIMGRLTAQQPDQPYPIEVLEEQRAGLSASAFGSGKILLSRDMARTHDDDMLAFVLAHELAHDQHLDAPAGLARREIVDAVADSLHGPEIAGAMKHEAHGADAAISREDELAADAAAIRLVARSGFDPRAALRSMDLMAREFGQPAQEGVYDSHPRWATRRAAIETIIDSEGLDAVYQENRPR